MKNIKAIILDVDGTLTDGKIYMGDQGEMMKAFDIKDGCAIHDIMPKYHIEPVIITGRSSKIVENRCRELKIKYIFQGCKNKLDKMKQLAEELNLYADENGIYQQIAYMGDDLIDISCMERAGIVGCPSDAVKEVKSMADFISSKKGGEGAVREFIEWIVELKDKKEETDSE